MSRLVVSILALGLCAATGAASAQSYPGDRGGHDRYEPYDRADDRGGAFHDEATVIRVDPVFDDGDDRYAGGYGRDPYDDRYLRRDGYGRPIPTASRACYTRDETYADGYGGGYRDDGYRGGGYRQPQGSETGRTVATVVGGVVGAVLGSKVGGGSGRYATTAVGTMVGGMAGRGIYDANQRQRHAQVTVCEPDAYGDDGDRGYGTSGVRWYDVTYEYGGRRHVTRTDYHPGDTLRVRVDVRAD